jgi:hypothetical protein
VRHRGCRAQRGNRARRVELPGAAMDTQEARQCPPGARANRHDALIPTQITHPVAYAPNMIRRLKINRRRRGCGHCGQLRRSCPSGCGQREALSKVAVGRPWRALLANAFCLGISLQRRCPRAVHRHRQPRQCPQPDCCCCSRAQAEANRPACARLRAQGAASMRGVSANELGQDRLAHGRFDPTRPQRLVAKASPVRGGSKAPR